MTDEEEVQRTARELQRTGDGQTVTFNGGAINARREELARDTQPGAPPVPGLNRPREITITALGHGYLVKVGCQDIAIEDRFKLIKKLGDYLADWNKTEAEYLKGTLL